MPPSSKMYILLRPTEPSIFQHHMPNKPPEAMHQRTQKQCPPHNLNSLTHQSLFGMFLLHMRNTTVPPMTIENNLQNTGHMRSPLEMRTIPESKWYKLKLLQPNKIQRDMLYRS